MPDMYAALANEMLLPGRKLMKKVHQRLILPMQEMELKPVYENFRIVNISRSSKPKNVLIGRNLMIVQILQTSDISPCR